MEVPVCGVGGGAVGAGVYIDGESTWEAAGENKTYGWMDMHVGTGKPIITMIRSAGRIELKSDRCVRAGQANVLDRARGVRRCVHAGGVTSHRHACIRFHQRRLNFLFFETASRRQFFSIVMNAI